MRNRPRRLALATPLNWICEAVSSGEVVEHPASAFR
jgi:hypothetical protein